MFLEKYRRKQVLELEKVRKQETEGYLTMYNILSSQREEEHFHCLKDINDNY